MNSLLKRTQPMNAKLNTDEMVIDSSGESFATVVFLAVRRTG
jgi:hypothetical protein